MIMSTKEICKRGLSMTISLTLGNSCLIVGDGLPGNMEPLGHLILGQAQLTPAILEVVADVHGGSSLLCFQ